MSENKKNLTFFTFVVNYAIHQMCFKKVRRKFVTRKLKALSGGVCVIECSFAYQLMRTGKVLDDTQ